MRTVFAKRRTNAVTVLLASLGLTLAACGNNNPQNEACRAMARSGLPWGYYPGYGCGPVPRAQTMFSILVGNSPVDR